MKAINFCTNNLVPALYLSPSKIKSIPSIKQSMMQDSITLSKNVSFTGNRTKVQDIDKHNQDANISSVEVDNIIVVNGNTNISDSTINNSIETQNSNIRIASSEITGTIDAMNGSRKPNSPSLMSVFGSTISDLRAMNLKTVISNSTVKGNIDQMNGDLLLLRSRVKGAISINNGNCYILQEANSAFDNLLNISIHNGEVIYLHSEAELAELLKKVRIPILNVVR